MEAGPASAAIVRWQGDARCQVNRDRAQNWIVICEPVGERDVDSGHPTRYAVVVFD